MSVYVVQVVYDRPDSAVQCKIETVSSLSLEQAQNAARRMLDELKWDKAFCYSGDLPELQSMDDW